MNDSIMLPDVHEISTWLGERCYLERARLRNELSFIQSDRARGGPSREDLATELKSRLHAIAKRLETISSGHSPLCRPRANGEDFPALARNQAPSAPAIITDSAGRGRCLSWPEGRMSNRK
jgi:hypothetical protein